MVQNRAYTNHLQPALQRHLVYRPMALQRDVSDHQDIWKALNTRYLGKCVSSCCRDPNTGHWLQNKVLYWNLGW